MFAIVKTGGKQYRVSPGDVVLVEKLQGEAGQAIDLETVLMYGETDKVTVGSPLLAGASVQATIRTQTRGDKIIVFKKRRRQGYRRTKGHRQDLTLLTINSITVGGKMVAGDAPKAEKKAAAPKAEKAADAPVKAEKKAAAPKAEKAAEPKAEKVAAPKKAAAPKAKKTDSKE